MSMTATEEFLVEAIDKITERLLSLEERVKKLEDAQAASMNGVVK